MIKFLLSLLISLVLSSPVFAATTYYIRTDGGTDVQCTGTTDAAYDGAGTGEACAYSHPFYAQRVKGSTATGNFVGGDTMIISPGTYDIGAGHATTGEFSGSICGPTYSYNCEWEIPAGPSAGNPTRILGKGYDTETGQKPILRGVGGLYTGVITLDGADNVEFQYLEITDGVACQGGFDNPSVACSGDYAQNAIFSKGGSDNILINNVNMHGLATRCVMFSGASNWVVTDTICRGVGFGAFDSDHPTETTGDSQSGTMTFTNVTAQWIGCIENLDGSIMPRSCVGQGGSYWHGYGDAFGFTSDAPGTMANWIIDGLLCENVMQDCFDGLHGDGTGYVKITNSLFQSINGASIKTVNPVTVENSIIIDNCSWAYETGMMYLDGVHDSDMLICRADASISIAGVDAIQHKFYGNTIFGNHNQIFSIFGSDGCDSSEIELRNNIIIGGYDAQNDTTHPYGGFAGTSNVKTDSYYIYSSGGSGCAGMVMDEDYNIFYNTKDSTADVTGAHSYYGDPGFSSQIKGGPYNTIGYFNTHEVWKHFILSSGSQARFTVRGADSADESLTFYSNGFIDYQRKSRGATWDTGALEYGGGSKVSNINIGGGLRIGSDNL